MTAFMRSHLALFISTFVILSNVLAADKIFAPESIEEFGLKSGEVVLTIDDGPSPATVKILDLLKDYNIKAHFFVTGTQAKRFPEIMERMALEGHGIANHTSTHLFDYPTVDFLYEDILSTHEVIVPYIEKSLTKRLYFRSPGGVWNDWRFSALNNHPVIQKYIGPIYWNVGGELIFDNQGKILQAADWDCWSSGVSVETCALGYYRELSRRGKGVILMHDIKMNSAYMLEELLKKITTDNMNTVDSWVFKSLDELSELDRYN